MVELKPNYEDSQAAYDILAATLSLLRGDADNPHGVSLKLEIHLGMGQ